jgi:SAM-dependent methyltransferase
LDASAIAAHWAKTKSSANWWTHKAVVRDYNIRVCGKPLNTLAEGIQHLIQSYAPAPLKRGISVGCGTGVKEIALIKAGVVDSIMGYDLSPDRIAVAEQKAREAGVAHQASFYCMDAFETHKQPAFDLVYWNNALHHMPDVAGAVKWSNAVLQDGGLFAIDEYVGPNRFRVTDQEFEFLNSVRSVLPDHVFLKPNGQSYPKTISRAWLEKTIEKDPSEAVDAGATVPAIKKVFPDALIRPAGGMLYFLALNGLYAGLRDEAGTALLKTILMLDREAVDSGRTRTLYATAIAVKGRKLEKTPLDKANLAEQLATTRASLSRVMQDIDRMQRSLSWRITKPLRWF